MTAKKGFFAALFTMCWSWCAAAQEPYSSGNMPAPLPKKDMPARADGDEGGTGLSRWITYDRDNCCIAPANGVPIMTEVFLRFGPSVPIGGSFLSRNLDVGWMIEPGVRAMFFNQESSRAWGVELGISNTHNGSHSTNTILLTRDVPNQTNNIGVIIIQANTPVPVMVTSEDRTFVNLAIGREWYLWSPANSHDGRVFRVGADVGGRWGSTTIRFDGPIPTPPHRTQVIEGVFAAAHADLEIPCGRWICFAGIRGEYGYTFSQIFDNYQGNVQDLTFLFNLGVRF